jgi:hypothetical protein
VRAEGARLDGWVGQRPRCAGGHVVGAGDRIHRDDGTGGPPPNHNAAIRCERGRL